MPVCELCGNTNFVKEEGMFVCQGCGTKYSLEDARNLPATPASGVAGADGATSAAPGQATSDAVAPDATTSGQAAPDTTTSGQAASDAATSGQAAPDTAAPDTTASAKTAAPSVAQVVGGVAAAALGALLDALTSPDDFKPASASTANDARSINNYIAQGWQMTVDAFKKIEHPTKEQLDDVVAKAKDSLIALDNAAMLEPEKYVQNALIYNNCKAIEECVLDLDCYEKKDGEWKRVSFPVKRSDVAIPGQKDSWTDKCDAHQQQIEHEYWGMHETEVALRAELEEQASKIRAQLDELKAEKRSKGFFNFTEKGEVKERMRPVKEQLKDVTEQIRTIERAAETYVRERIEELGTSFTILSF